MQSPPLRKFGVMASFIATLVVFFASRRDAVLVPLPAQIIRDLPMKKITAPVLGITLAGVLALLVTSASTQAQITDLASFNGTNGAIPFGSLRLSGSTFYGTTQQGGANGAGEVFSLPVGGGTPTILASFNGANGAVPQGSLTLSGSTLYGTTAGGGANGAGGVFSLPVGGGTPTILASFNGANPYGSLTLSGSKLYGTTAGAVRTATAGCFRCRWGAARLRSSPASTAPTEPGPKAA